MNSTSQPHWGPPLVRRGRGLTLVELIATLTVVAIVTAVAIPQMGQFVRAAARRTAVNDMMHSVFLARSKAIMANTVVSICRSQDGQFCSTSSGNWEDGWIVFINSDRDQPAVRDAGEEIIQRHNGWRGGLITSNRTTFSFRPTTQSGVNGTVVFCDPLGQNADARAIIISHTGRPRVSMRNASNQPLSCP